MESLAKNPFLEKLLVEDLPAGFSIRTSLLISNESVETAGILEMELHNVKPQKYALSVKMRAIKKVLVIVNLTKKIQKTLNQHMGEMNHYNNNNNNNNFCFCF